MSRCLDADALRKAMVARNLTNADLARLAGVDADTIARALDPEASLTVRTENRILAAIGRQPVDQDAAAGLRELSGDGAAA